MGFGIKELVIILIIILLLFGTRKLKTLGGDLGSALKGFRKSINDDEEPAKKNESNSEDIVNKGLPDSDKKPTGL